MGLPALLSPRFWWLYLVWLLGPWVFAGPVLAVQSLVFGKSPDEWGRGAAPQRDFALLFADHFITWALSYGSAWILLFVCHKLGGKYNREFPAPGFVAVEAARSVGGLAVLTLYHWAVVEAAYGGFLPSLIVPSSPEAALANMPPLGEVLWPWGIITAAWGDIHFYLTHRGLHAVPALYNAVHKVHHRSFNTDPFSGLSMHPVEHLVYASSVLLLPLVLAPFGGCPFWVLRSATIGLILYPIPGHIGCSPFERWHWDHHTKFNWNFGSSPMFDILFETDYETYQEGRRAGDPAAAAARQQAKVVGAPLAAPSGQKS